MKAVCAGALAIGCVIFMVLALGSIAAFGPAVNSNILNNLSATGMTPLIGAAAAQVMKKGVGGCLWGEWVGVLRGRGWFKGLWRGCS